MPPHTSTAANISLLLVSLLAGCSMSSAQDVAALGPATTVHYRLFGGMPRPLRELTLDIRTARITGTSRSQNGGRTFGVTQTIDLRITRAQANGFAEFARQPDARFLQLTTRAGPVGRTEFLELANARGQRVRVGVLGVGPRQCVTRGDAEDQAAIDRFVAMAHLDSATN